MKHVDIKELEKVAAPVKMDREAKLKHWAKLIRKSAYTDLTIFHNLETGRRLISHKPRCLWGV